jgi:two-component system, NarL family, nitrate/nitrite response regulator NarL
MVRVVVISGVRLYREGLVALLDQADGISVLGSTGDGAAAVACIVTCQPDVALLDMAMPSSVEMLPVLFEASPRLKVVGLAVGESEPAILAAVDAGVDGYVLRRDSLNDLILVIRGVASDGAISSPRIVASLMQRLAILASQPPPDALAERLTIREAEIIALVAQGMTNKEIARQLFIQLPTVKNHVHNILNKLQLRHRGQAAALANHRHLDRRI